MKKVTKKLHDVRNNEVFELVNSIVPHIKGKMIRLFGTKYNVLCLTSFQIGQLPFDEDVTVIGALKVDLFSGKSDSRFDELFGAAVNNLHEFYDELGDASVVDGIKERVENFDTGDDQKDYERIKNSVEKHVQGWITDRRFS